MEENRAVKEYLTTASDGKNYRAKIYKPAVDNAPKASEPQEFFSLVQNKLHFAIAEKTASELIAARADAAKLAFETIMEIVLGLKSVKRCRFVFCSGKGLDRHDKVLKMKT